MAKHTSHARKLLISGTLRLPCTLYLLALLLLAGVLWSHLTPVDIFVRAPGLVRPEGEVVRIAAEVGGQVEAVYTREGAVVEAGDVLLQLDTSGEHMKRRMVTRQIELVEAQLGHLRDKLETRHQIHRAEQDRLDAEERAARETLERQIEEHRASIDAAGIRLVQAHEDYSTNAALLDEGLVSRLAWSTARTELRLAESDYDRIAAGGPDRSAVQLIGRTREVARTQFAADVADVAAAIYPIELELAELRLELDYVLTEERRRAIRAPARGQIALLENIHRGEQLQAGAVIATLESSPERRVVEAVLANVDARDVHPGQRVRLLLNDGEIVDGRVSSVSPDVRMGEATAGTFRVIVAPLTRDLRLGLALEVRFITKTKTVLSLLAGRVTDSFQDFGG